MTLPLIIQGGMGVGVSDWRLARAVSVHGELGVVSGTGINTVVIRRLQRGDPGGHVRRALSHFPCQTTAQKLISTYHVEGGIKDDTKFKLASVPSVNPTRSLQQSYAAAAFVEVWLAKEGHDGIVGINFLEKLQTSNLPSIYGAMLAGVDYVLMGAGVPRDIPQVLDLFAEHEKASIKVTLGGNQKLTDVTISFDPQIVLPPLTHYPTNPTVSRPRFLPIVSSVTLAAHLLSRSPGGIDGFIVEGVRAGGHNAPPRGQLKLNNRGEPLYTSKDDANLNEIRSLGLPFWLAGGFGSHEQLAHALELGAAGIQVGTAFAFCDESGVTAALKHDVLRDLSKDSSVVAHSVFTDPRASPTGLPFKVVQVPGTLSDADVFERRPRKCDVGYLRQVSVGDDGKLVYYCPAEPVDDYVRKGGDAADTVNRKCLCNALLSNIGLGQVQEGNYHEPPLLTAGDDLATLDRFLKPGQTSYTAHDVLEYLKSGRV